VVLVSLSVEQSAITIFILEKKLINLSIEQRYLSYLGIQAREDVFYNLTQARLVEGVILNQEGVLSNTGAVIVETGVHTGRSPNDKYLVDYQSKADAEIEWGAINTSLSPEHYEKIYSKVIHYLAGKKIYVQDVVAGRDQLYAKTFRIISENAWAILFSRDLLKPVTLSPDNLPDFTLLHAPNFFANPAEDGTRTGTFIIINFEKRTVLIGGSSYAGEIKKSVFTVMNRILPEKNVFPMHCSANIGNADDTALFFGLSGTGKTTLSSSPDRRLIGDDEHGWSANGIFNFENGCYAKTINLNRELEPLIWEASQRFGSVLENVGHDPETREIDFNDSSKTENTRAAYPLAFIDNHIETGIGNHPENIFFLSADAFGVLPPISQLSKEQAVYYFLLGYTAKLAGTERGLGKEPEATFSTCFGEPFLPLSPIVYADMLLKRIMQHQPHVWLINTGWSGGPYGVGARIKLPYSRAMIRLALEKKIPDSDFKTESVFGLKVPLKLEGVPDEILEPVNTWQDRDTYYRTAAVLIAKIHQRMERFADYLDPAILQAGPPPV
jgi:phosphoenolpyruvate carboxykinase (ATP)